MGHNVKTYCTHPGWQSITSGCERLAVTVGEGASLPCWHMKECNLSKRLQTEKGTV